MSLLEPAVPKISEQVEQLAHTIQRHVPASGDFPTGISALSLHRRDAPGETLFCTYPLSLAVTVKGGKQITFGSRVLSYGPGSAMFTSIDLPISSQITNATKEQPYLALLLRMDAGIIARAATEMNRSQVSNGGNTDPLSIERLESELLDSLARLVSLLDSPQLLPLLAPLTLNEIAIRFLAGPYGAHLRRLNADGSASEQITDVVAWIKKNYAKAIPVDEMAAKANVSPSSFRQKFRSLTGMSPLQYQKHLRLLEARQLMLNRNLDAGSAAYEVGYESVSQFSREYRRQFGEPPQRDVHRLRSDLVSSA